MRTLVILSALLAVAAGESLLPVPPERAGLTIPDAVWDAALEGTGRPGRPLGYTAEEMANYSGRRHLLRTVENLFRDARTLPRFSGKLAESLVKYASTPAEAVRVAYGLTDAVAGRNLPLNALDDLKTEEEIEKAIGELIMPRTRSRRRADGRREVWTVRGLSDEEQAEFRLLGAAERRLLVRLIRAVREAGPWIADAYGEWRKASSGDRLAADSYALAVATLDEDRMGQLATRNRLAFEALDLVDRECLAFGSVMLTALIHQALEEYRASDHGDSSEEFAGMALDTVIGSVRVHGPGDDRNDTIAALALDVGGDDEWVGRHGTVVRGGMPVGIAVDLSGNDKWDGRKNKPSLGCGLFGYGAIFDLAGDDDYRGGESSLGVGWFGTGLVVDGAGNDRYETATHWGQGCGYAGVGMLIDRAGDDEYVIGHDGQGYGATLGAGVLIDVEGSDTYLARDDGNISALYKGQSVSMAQGVGQGRRADLGDGHSLAGGFGVLVDGAGNDSYHATCWSHGAGYWWAVGILEDLGGDDTYRDGKYSLGAGAHFAIGVCVDFRGDDRYNVGYADAVNQFQGHARDGSIGVFVDGDGKDHYQLRAHCGGSGDLASIGLFWDRRGDDIYEITAVAQGKGDWGGTPPLGSTTTYKPMRSYRDDLDTAGVFLDTGGGDEYRGPAGKWGNGKEWRTERGPRFRGYGRDAELYAPPK